MINPINQPIPSHDNTRRILIIEDDQHLARVIVAVLARAGFETTVASTGNDGVRESEERKFDLIVSDIDLPDLTGFEVCVRIKQNPRLHAIPILLMSGRTIEENEATALKCGAGAFLSKPFKTEKFINQISVLLTKAQNEGQ